MSPTARLRASLAAVKNPSYTGPNRCLPCTLLNLAIALALSAVVVAAAATTGRTVSLVLGVGTLTGAAAVIYLRGYLIPGTPTLTKRYVPDRLLALFDAEPAGVDRVGTDPQELLLEVGIVLDDPIVADLVLAPAFADVWERAIASHRADERAVRESLGALVGADPDELAFEDRPHAFLAWADEESLALARWPSRAACVADAAAATAMPDFDPDWNRRPLPVRVELLGVLRLFLEQCPACDGPTALSQDVVESCCRNRDVVAATCRDCDTRLFEMDVDPSLLGEE